jgi:hypothetical protein
MNLKRCNPRVSRLAAIALLSAGLSIAQTLPTAKSIASEMGIAWNLGNTLELSGVQPIPTQALFDSVKAAGFKTVRLPCAWYSHSDSSYAIDATWMAQVKTVVDYAIKDSLFVMLNIHWDGGWLQGNIDAAVTNATLRNKISARQGAFWRQIATTFKNYDRHLVFASTNEPQADSLSAWKVLLGFHQIFVDTVRATGGNNASRALIVQGPNTSFDESTQWMTLPNDKAGTGHLMVEDHFYPYQFCLMDKPAYWNPPDSTYPVYYWGKGFHSATDTKHNAVAFEETYVDSQFNQVVQKFGSNVPIVIGEFGVMKRLTLTGDNLKLHVLSRRHFYNYVVKSAIGKGMIPVAWDAGGLGDGTMSVFRRSNKEGAIYDLGLLNAMRSGAGLSKLAGDTTSDYTLATGDNSLRILYSAKDSTNGKVSFPISRPNISSYDSIVAKIYVKGTSDYDSAGTAKYGYMSLSFVTMSTNSWTWREKTLGTVTMDGWKNYSIPLSSDVANTAALVPADPTNILFFGLIAYSKAFRGAIYVDWIVFKNKSGSSDTVYNFNQTGPQDGDNNVESVSLYPTANVASDLTWQTATTSVWGVTALSGRKVANTGAFAAFASMGTIRATFHAEGSEPAVATLRDMQGRKIWSRSFETVAGTNELEIPALRSGAGLLTIRTGSSELVGNVYCP